MCTKKTIFTVILICFSIQIFAQNYALVWSDEFEYEGLPNSDKWSYEEGGDRNQEAQYYTVGRSENARVENGTLIIEARKEDFNGKKYTSASIISKDIGDWQYGKFEFSMKVPTGNGTWPAIWMMPTYSEYGLWPKSGEIDIMEYVGYDPQKLWFNTWTEGLGDEAVDNPSGGISEIIDPFNQFVKITYVWTPEKMEWYANDVKYHEIIKTSSDPKIWPFDKHFYLILNLAIGGSWGGLNGIDDGFFPHQFIIDYVRVYQLQESEGPYTLTVKNDGDGSIEISPVLDSYPEGTEVTLTAIPDEGNKFAAWRNFSGANPYQFVLNKNTEISAEFKKLGEVLSNSTFSNRLYEPWTFWTAGGDIVYEASVINEEFVINVTNPPVPSDFSSWHVTFQEHYIPLVSGIYYVTFDAYADQEANLHLMFANDDDVNSDWSIIQEKSDITVSTEKARYTWEVELSEDKDFTRLAFGIGNFSGKFTIDNISMVNSKGEVTHVLEREFDSINIFPNPVENRLYIDANKAFKKALVYDLFGQKIIETKGGNSSVDVSHINPGIYMLLIESKDGQILKRKFVKK